MNDTSSWSPLFRVIGPSGDNTLSLAELLESYPYLSGILADMKYDDDFQLFFRRTATGEELSVERIGWTTGDWSKRVAPVEPDAAAHPSPVLRRVV